MTNRSGMEYPSTGMIEYSFPLRPGSMARLVVPKDLTKQEVKRIAKFLRTLAVVPVDVNND